MDKKKPKRKNNLKELEKPTKDETAVAKYLKFNAQTKPGKFMGNDVQYFIGSKIVDFLLESKWSNKNPKAKNLLFTSRASCVIFCQQLLDKGFFHRVCKPERTEKKLKKEIIEESSITKRKSRKEIQASIETKKDGTDEAKVEKSDSKDDLDDKKKKKKKQKLEMHDQQYFKDGPDLYVWIYDPVSMKTFIIGLLLVVGSIGVCLFPLWPPEVKIGIYYLSMVAAGFIGLILVLCVVRMILFVLAWISSVGKISFWLLPNLTEDVGFFESFAPLYKVEYKLVDGNNKEKNKKSKGKTADASVKESISCIDNKIKAIDAGDDDKEKNKASVDIGDNDDKGDYDNYDDDNEGDNDDNEDDNGYNEEGEDYDDNKIMDDDNDEDDEGDNSGDNGDGSNGYELLDVDDYDDDERVADNSSNSGDEPKKDK